MCFVGPLRGRAFLVHCVRWPALMAAHPALRDMRIMRSSDAHYLENMREAMDYIHPSENTAAALIRHLQEK